MARRIAVESIGVRIRQHTRCGKKSAIVSGILSTRNLQNPTMIVWFRASKAKRDLALVEINRFSSK
jgi:hypothetical protein